MADFSYSGGSLWKAFVGKSPFAFCWLGPEAGISKAAAAAPNQARKI